MIKTKHLISYLILISFYVLLGYLLLGTPWAILAGGGIYLMFLLVSSYIPYQLLTSEQIKDGNYEKERVMTVVNITHVLLMLALIGFVIFYNREIGEISPTLGYIVVSLSLLINIICLFKDLKKKWTWIALGLHILVFIMFAFWQIVGFGLILLGFFYMAIHDIFIVSYGILRYDHLIRSKKAPL